MSTHQLSDTETLLNEHLPKDSFGRIPPQVLSDWARALETADTVVVEWVESYGRKLRASWFSPGGRLLASTARPPSRADSIRDFVRDWEQYAQRHGRCPAITWGEGTRE
jgi:hypothetical protein